jgi:Polyketide cyclase / dehydrase and lipid transport
MRRTVARLDLPVPPPQAFDACLRLLTDADPRRGMLERRCEPSPPEVGSVVVTTLRSGGGTRELRATVVALDPPHEVATAAEGDGPAVRTALRCEPGSGSGTVVTLTSEVAGAVLPGTAGGAAGRLLDELLFGRSQRRSARETLRRLRELAQPC